MNLHLKWITKIGELSRENKCFAIVTVIKTLGSTPREVGAKMLVVSKNEFYGTIGGGKLEATVLAKVSQMLLQKTQDAQELEFSFKDDLDMICGGGASIFVEFINSASDVYIFGSGHVALALAQVLDGSPFRVNVVDEREEWLKKLPEKVIKHQTHFSNFIEKHSWSKEKSFVVIMTPGHISDKEILVEILSKEVAYLGMIGSKTKWAQLKKELIERGIETPKLEKVFCPIGLPIGGKSPCEIAISIAAQLLSKYYS